MRFYVALSRAFDLDAFERQALEDRGPGHGMWHLREGLDATVLVPETGSASRLDRALARIVATPAHWRLARRHLGSLLGDAFVYCTGGDVGLPLAILSRPLPFRPRLAVTLMSPERPRVRALFRAFRLHRSIDLVLVNTEHKAHYVAEHLRVPRSRIFVLPEQCDTRFFRPGPAAKGPRPLVASAGLEQRDYATLADATAGLDVDVRICAMSPNASARTTVALPETLPPNMRREELPWRAFRQLYWDADVVVIPLLRNDYSAGLTVLMEAAACRRPTIVTRTRGLASEWIDRGLVVGVEPGDAAGLRAAIERLLAHPQEATAFAERAHAHLLRHHTMDHFVELLTGRFRAVAGGAVEVEPPAVLAG